MAVTPGIPPARYHRSNVQQTRQSRGQQLSICGGADPRCSTRRPHDVLCDKAPSRCAVLCCTALCCTARCIVLCCAVLCCAVLCCAVLRCAVLRCAALCCAALCCAVLCCAAVLRSAVLCCAVPKALLPEGNGRDVYPRVQVNGRGCVCCVRAVCMCVGPGGERGSREDLVGPPLATVLTPGAPAALPLAPLVGALYTPGGPAALRGSAGLLPIAPVQPAPIAGGALGPLVFPPSGRATLLAAGGPASIHGIGPSRPRGGALSRAALRKGGTWHPAPCPGERNGGLGQSSSGCCPYDAP